MPLDSRLIVGDALWSEQWVRVPGFEIFYSVSSFGNVLSFHFGEPRPKKSRPNCDGYPVLVLYGGGKRKTIPLHRLVAEVFHADKRNALHCEVAHLDGNRRNARADNLKWVSKVENHAHKRLHGTHQARARHPRTKLSEADVSRIRTRYGTSKEIAADYGISRQTVFDIWQGRSWKPVSIAIAGEE